MQNNSDKLTNQTQYTFKTKFKQKYIKTKKHNQSYYSAKTAQATSQTSMQTILNNKSDSKKKKKEISTKALIKPLNITSIIIGSNQTFKPKRLKRQDQCPFLQSHNPTFAKTPIECVSDEEEIFTFKEESNKELSKVYTSLSNLSENKNFSNSSINSKQKQYLDDIECLDNLQKNIGPACFYCKIF
jgi:hypothetical protein